MNHIFGVGSGLAWLLLARLATAQTASDSAPSGGLPVLPGETPHPGLMVALTLLVLCVIALLAVVCWQALRLRRLAGRALPPVSSAAPAPAVPAAAPTSEAAQALEASKQVIHGLLRNISEFLDEMLTRNAGYHDRIEQHRVAIRKAMTMAGLEEIERLLLTEIDALQTSSETYRRQLDQADQRLREQQAVIEQIQVDARQDFLTAIPNRRAFDQRLREELARAARYGTAFSLLMLDIDHFKQLNDTHGHLAGDKMLQVVARVIGDQLRATDFVGRYGGEEFTVLLPETPARRARLVGERIRQAVEQAALKYETAILRVTVSIGVSEVAVRTDTPETLIARADAALYQAKQSGRNRVQLAVPPA